MKNKSSLPGLIVPDLMTAYSPDLPGGDQDNGAMMSLNFKQDTQHTYKEMLHQALKYRKIEGGN